MRIAGGGNGWWGGRGCRSGKSPVLAPISNGSPDGPTRPSSPPAPIVQPGTPPSPSGPVVTRLVCHTTSPDAENSSHSPLRTVIPESAHAADGVSVTVVTADAGSGW